MKSAWELTRRENEGPLYLHVFLESGSFTIYIYLLMMSFGIDLCSKGVRINFHLRVSSVDRI